MFSGIVEEKGTIQKVQKKENLVVLTIKANTVIKNTKIGDSIAIDGICLTVTEKGPQTLTFDVMKETLLATTLKDVRSQKKVNLERALKISDRIGGHFVSGHIDGTGYLKKIITLPNYVEWRITVNKKLMKYIAPKGSVCVDGVSLTIGAVKKKYFSIYLIPHTLEVTTFGNKKEQQKLNIETDILAKYVLKDIKNTPWSVKE